VTDVLVLGGSGQLGQAIQKAAGALDVSIHAPTSREVDVRDSVGVSSLVDRVRPAHVINCAAYTSVDAAESQPDLAFAINSTGAQNVATACAASGARLIHVSTDYVFDGESRRPYRETDAVRPINVYGASKLLGEQHVLTDCPDAIVVRVSWLFGSSPSSFVGKILTRALSNEPLRVVNDQVGCPTSARGAAEVLLRLIDPRAQWLRGVFHYCELPATSWFGFAQEIVRQALDLGILALPVDVTPISSEELASRALRPKYSVLDSHKLNAEMKIDGGFWPSHLRAVMEAFVSRP
jgi:dTDP-4-dehydrorhamnose reductase